MLCCAMLHFDATNAHLKGVKAATVRRADGQGGAAQHKTAGRQHSVITKQLYYKAVVDSLCTAKEMNS